MPQPGQHTALAQLSSRSDMADIDARLQVQLYSKLATALSVEDTAYLGGGSLLSILLPGLYIQPNLNPDDDQTQYVIANALDATMACSWTFVPGPGTVSDVYKSILDGKETPLTHLTPEQLRRLDDALGYLFLPDGQPTEAYCEYRDHELGYLAALDAYEAARATQDNGGARIPARLKKALERAAREWSARGHKGDVERAIATIDALEGLEPEMWWARLSARYREATRRYGIDSHFQYVTSNPPYQEWFHEFGWSDFSFDTNDYAEQDRSGGVGVTPCRCRCTTAAEAEPATARTGDVTALSTLWHEQPPPGFTLTCRLRRVQIIRPWMDTSVFFSRAWRWSPASVSYGVVISTGGDLAGAVAPTGMLPVLPTTAILARDVVIRWDDADGADVPAEPDLVAGELAFGPFRLSRAALATTGRHVITIPDPQLIGYIGTLIPRCPNPEPTLPWPLTTRSTVEFPATGP